MIKKFNLILLVFAIQIIASGIVLSNTVQYLSPVPGSVNNLEATSIIIGFTNKINPETINTTNIKVIGSFSGIHSGKVIFAEKNTKILFKPDAPFTLGEKVTVSGLNNVSDFSFYIRASKPEISENDCRNMILKNELGYIPTNSDKMNPVDSLPALTIYNSGTTADGYLFFANFGTLVNSVLMVLNNDGSPNFARTLRAKAYDFKKQNDNLLTYYYEIGNKYFGIDQSYNIVDSFYAGGGYTIDFHELVVMPDSSAWFLIYDKQYVDMSVIVPGGKTNALVTGLIVQKIDAEKNVVFQWRSWDHFQITDATHENLTASSIDYVHGNSIEVDNDSNIFISSRHLDEITKINANTGDVIWRFGGTNNQFTFVNDTIGFSHQHCARRLPNGNLLLFDNGNYHSPQFSRAVEYTLNETTKTATLVWEYRHNPSIYASAMGSVQRLSNGNTLIGWGSASTTLTEVTPEGTIVYELSLPSNQMSYRAFRYEWGPLTNILQNTGISKDYKLYQNYPNPFNPVTNIKYQIPENGFVTLKVYDLLGKEVATLVNGYQKAGSYEKQFSLNRTSNNMISSGIYFYKITCTGKNNFTEVKKMVLIK